MSKKRLTDEKYTKRPSPPYHASAFPGKFKMGNDDYEYISKKDSNNVYKWVNVTNRKTPEEYWALLGKTRKAKYVIPSKTKMKKLTNELLKNNIVLYYSKWTESHDYSDIDDIVHSYMNKIGLKDTDNISYIFYTENRLYDAKRTGLLRLDHMIFKKDKKKVIEIFSEILGSDYKWTEKSTDNIIIKLHKI
jgi:hypothetical protein